MQRKSFGKLLLIALGYMLLGNIMSTIMTVSLAVVGDNTIVQVVLFIFTLFVFYALVFTAAFKDGAREGIMLKNHRIEQPLKFRWLTIGVIMWLVMCIPSVVLIIDKLVDFNIGYLIAYRMLCGTIYPFAQLMGITMVETPDMPMYFPFIVMGIYVFIPLVTHIGFDVGFKDKFNPEKIMYEKSK